MGAELEFVPVDAFYGLAIAGELRVGLAQQIGVRLPSWRLRASKTTHQAMSGNRICELAE